MSYTDIEKCNPNRHGLLALRVYGDVNDPEEDLSYVVVEPGDTDGVEFDGNLEGARSYYEERKTFWMNEPNWQAQAEYDEAHGTVNGYSSWQYEREY